jgi:ATP-dependent Clp protease ATP-binding subunit ClpC
VTPLLCQIGKNLTLAAQRGELDPVIGRDEEIERVLDVLAKREARNPCLIGVPGVGKTSVVRGLALHIAKREGTSELDERVIVEIEPAALLSGTGLRGALAERIAQLKTELKATGSRVVVFFDEIHTLFADASDEGASELRAALAHGELVCIGACTREEFRRFVETDPALLRRFSVIEIEEPSREDAFLALEAMLPAFERHHHATYSKEAIACAVQWSIRYVTGRALPDKAVGILDLAGARVRRRGEREILPEDVADVVSDLASVPTERLLETDGGRMLKLESLLAERVVGHAPELARISSVLRRNASGIRGKRPIGTFLLLGPTGVGKTETAKAIAECLFHSEAAMTRLDMSEYAEPHAIARLVGAPPGYVGHESGGQLTEAARRRPYQVILLDEIEKAHRDVLEAFLQVFDEGRLTDGRGRTVDFTNAVLVLTSNLGADKLAPSSRTRGIGFSSSREARAADDVKQTLLRAAREGLPPELYNRIDEVLAFGPLLRAEVAEVARRMLSGLGADLEAARGVRLQVSPAVIDLLLEKGGYDPDLGARPMRRAITRLVEGPLSEMLLRREARPGDVVLLECEAGAIVVDTVTAA